MSPDERLPRRSGGLPLRSLLVLSLSAVIVCLTTISLLIVDAHLHRQIEQYSRLQFQRSLKMFTDAEAQRLVELRRENALLADLPSLKALMTTSDDRTIEDGGRRFMQIGNNDLFALAGSDGHIAAVYTRDPAADASLRNDLQAALDAGDSKRYVVSGDHLFGYAVRPVYFGEDQKGTLVGYVLTAYAVDAELLKQLLQASALEIVFRSGHTILASTLPPGMTPALSKERATSQMRSMELAGEHFNEISRDLSAEASSPLQIQLLRSTREADADAHVIDRLLALIGFFTGLAGAAVMLAISAGTTYSLRALARSVEAFGRGEHNTQLPSGGPREVRQLSEAFAAMRSRIEETRRALLEAERLATIGRMARSVSHDLRHYLSAVYANAEFLATANLDTSERAECFEEIRNAVLGTTDMIESLLLFSRTGNAPARNLHDVDTMLRRALDVIERHPDAQGVQRRVLSSAGVAMAFCDSRQIERALCNLLLNAAQAARLTAPVPIVEIALTKENGSPVVRITDNGCGVPESVRTRLFEPFVSEGKQSGTGLGLTLAYQVARDHGGDLLLEFSSPGATCFRFTLSRPEGFASANQPESGSVVVGDAP